MQCEDPNGNLVYMRGPQNEGVPTYVENNVNGTEKTVRRDSQQVQ